MQKPIFANNYFYHLLNRGVDKRVIFQDSKDFLRFLESLEEFNCPENIKIEWVRRDKLKQVKPVKGRPLVLISAYCLLTNHFHLLVKQLVKGGISKFMQKLATGYTMYFNKKYQRVGRLFQSSFKAVSVETEEQLVHLSRYIHLNPIKEALKNASSQTKRRLMRQLISYQWSSYPEFIGRQKGGIAAGKAAILEMFGSKLSKKNPAASYQEFVESYVSNDIDLIDGLTLDD